MSEMDQVFYSCKIGEDYPFPIVDIEETRKYASEFMHRIKKTSDSKVNGKKILARHVSPSNNRFRRTRTK
jgi:deoxyribodipyrimidine photo-lyase